MDRFYLENVALYKMLLDELNATAPVAHFSRHKAMIPEDRRSTEVEANGYSSTIVCARIRPMLDDDLTERFPRAIFPREGVTTGCHYVDVHDLYNYPYGRPILKDFTQSSKFQVDRSFDSHVSTNEIHKNVVSDLVSHARHGGIATLFAYGQTGSGKTFTVSQLQKLAAISLIEDVSHDDLELHMTICDLAGNSACDLLNNRKPIRVLEDSFGATQLAGAKEYSIHSTEEVESSFDQAASLRATAVTYKNNESSRSHSICRIRVKDKSLPNVDNGILFFVDLAGSEAARDVAEHGADRMRETKEINHSLSVLKNCIRGKSEAEAMIKAELGRRQKKAYVPTRQSTLTRVLKHVFEPQGSRISKTVIIACVNPSLADVGPSRNTLRYAEMLRVRMSVPAGQSERGSDEGTRRAEK